MFWLGIWLYFFLLPLIYILRPIKSTKSMDMPRKKPTAETCSRTSHSCKRSCKLIICTDLEDYKIHTTEALIVDRVLSWVGPWGQHLCEIDEFLKCCRWITVSSLALLKSIPVDSSWFAANPIFLMANPINFFEENLGSMICWNQQDWEN
jgi:hypothetical protein